MADMFRRLVWFFIVACAVSYAVFVVAGSAIRAQALDESHVVLVRDSLKPGTHFLSGMVMVHSTCSQLSVRSEKLSQTEYLLIFTSWDEPSVACTEEETPRAFRVAVIAPAAGVHFTGSLDGEPLRLAVLPLVEHE